MTVPDTCSCSGTVRASRWCRPCASSDCAHSSHWLRGSQVVTHSALQGTRRRQCSHDNQRVMKRAMGDSGLEGLRAAPAARRCASQEESSIELHMHCCCADIGRVGLWHQLMVDLRCADSVLQINDGCGDCAGKVPAVTHDLLVLCSTHTVADAAGAVRDT